MAKHAGLFEGNAKGKVGDVVYSVVHGQQVARIHRPSNSSKGEGASFAQRAQRTRVANVAHFFQALRALFVQAFESKDNKLSNWNEFSRRNLPYANIYMTKEIARANGTVVFPAILTMGSLPKMQYAFDADAEAWKVRLATPGITGASTIGDLSKAVVENNEGWKYGDRLTFVYVGEDNQNVIDGVLDVPAIYPTIEAVTLDATNGNELPAYMKQMFNDTVGEDGFQTLNLRAGSVAFIHSRKVGSQVLVSPQQLAVGGSELYKLYSSEYMKELAAASYGYKENGILNPDAEGEGGLTPDAENGGGEGEVPDTEVPEEPVESVVMPTEIAVGTYNNIITAGSRVTLSSNAPKTVFTDFDEAPSASDFTAVGATISDVDVDGTRCTFRITPTASTGSVSYKGTVLFSFQLDQQSGEGGGFG